MIARPPIVPTPGVRPAHAKRPQEMPLEGVRGVAAIMVALSHLLYLDLLTPALKLPGWLKTVEGGHAGVLTFFVLSGYVIGWTNPEAYSAQGARSYAWRRFVRLVPIYFVAMTLTVGVIAFTGLGEPIRVVVGSYLGIQNFNGYFGYSVNPPLVNGPLWSLNFELVYYALFILLWKARPSLIWVFGPAALAAAFGWFAPKYISLFIAAYGSGWLFWAAGWWLSRRPQDGPEASDCLPIASWVLLIFAGHQLGGVTRILNGLGFYSNDAGMVTLGDLGELPSVLLVLGAVTRRNLPYRRSLQVAAWALCVVPILGLAAKGRILGQPAWLTGCAAVALAALLLPVRGTRWLKPFAWLGGISYAFYVVHFPLLYFVQFLPLPKTTALGFFERLPLWIGLTLALSWILERRFQPWIAGRLRRRRAPA